MPEYLILTICLAPVVMLIASLIWRKRLGRSFKYILGLSIVLILLEFYPYFFGRIQHKIHGLAVGKKSETSHKMINNPDFADKSEQLTH